MRTIPIKESLTIEFKSDKKKYSDADCWYDKYKRWYIVFGSRG